MLEESWPKIIGRGASETARPQAGVDKNKAKETWHGLNFCLVVPSLREKRAAVQSAVSYTHLTLPTKLEV